MSASQALGGPSLCGRALGPSLDKIVKNATWRKHSDLVSACKSALDRFESISESPHDSSSPLVGLSVTDADYVLLPLILALESNDAKVAEPALECAFRSFSLGLLRGEIDSGSVLSRLVESICKVVVDMGEEAIELAMVRVLLAAVRSPCVLIRGDCLVHVVRTCYNVYISGLSGMNQICAKSALAQMMLIVFKRVEEDSMDVSIKRISVSKLLESNDKKMKEGNSIRTCQNFVDEVMDASKGVPLINFPKPNLQNAEVKVDKEKGELWEVELEEGVELAGQYGSKIIEDGLVLFKNLCKLSMKSSSQENADDQIFLRGKILSLELLKLVMDNGGPVWCKNERFLNAMRQFLCLSLLRNCALSDMSIFLLQCSIFMTLLTKFRSGLKSEIGIIFPMLVLPVLENVLEPSFQQKMTILNLLDSISQDPQLIIDIFVNYDCDVDAPNIFERIVNGLLKTALGPPAGSSTTLTSGQDSTLQLDSVKCLVDIIKSLGTWMDKQMRVDDSYLPKTSVSDNSVSSHSTVSGEDGTFCDYDLHPETSSEGSNAAILEQRRAYKIELQKGISIFNRSPCKGIEFLIDKKKMGASPEDVASFLKKASGLNGTMIGDYLGEREEFALKVVHAYVDSFNFQSMDFGEAIRFFLNGFRLPGEAQKIDRIMEKFAECYCKCNPNSFKSADTAYVLAYSAIMLNTDSHNCMVKDKMVKADFIRNNRGIDDGKDLPEEYLSALYDQIVKNEIKMGADSSAPRSKQEISYNRLLGLDGILNLVTWKQAEEKAFVTNGHLMRRIQEQIKEKSGKSESIYHAVTDVAILRFMLEVFWGPMLAAFSMTLDRSNDKLVTSQCLQGFQYAVHVTAVIGMQTQRDAFLTSVAKFTHLHNAVEMKQKNVDAVKAIISIAIEDGNHLQDAWEHILTCLSRIERLQLLGEGASGDSSSTASSTERDDKTQKPIGLRSLKRKGSLQNPAVMAAVRGGSYDSATIGVNASALVTSEQINHFISNLNLLDQMGNFELNYVFAHSQHLNSEAIVAFVKSLCKVSQTELQSKPDPRFFSLTKLVEITQDNMNRIRLVWSRIWSVVSDFFVTVGLSDNLSVSIFVMDSLRQLAMKFLEREELAHYNFQNEFLRPFVIVMKKSRSAEIRELIVRCISQIVLSRVNNVKSGWKSVFMVFTTAAADDRKNIVSLAFETMEKIVRDYFPYIAETETTTFTDCVRCLITFTNTRFSSDVSLNAIAFLRFCALKLAEGGLVCTKNDMEDGSLLSTDNSDVQDFSSVDDHGSFWIPLLTGLSKLTSDPRLAIQRSSLEVLFNILKDHGHHFSQSFWFVVFISVVLPVYDGLCDNRDILVEDKQGSLTRSSEGNIWDGETAAVAVQCLLDLFISFFDVLRSQLPCVVSVFTVLLKSSIQGTASTGVSALLHLTAELGSKLSEEEWTEIFAALKEAGSLMLQSFLKVLTTMDQIKVPGSPQIGSSVASSPDHDLKIDCLLEDDMQTVAYVVSRMTSHIALQLLIIQVVTDLGKTHLRFFSAANIKIVLEIFSSIASHAQQLSSDTVLREKIQKACRALETSEPPLVHFENESYQNYLDFVLDVVTDHPYISEKMDMELELLSVCETILQTYLSCSDWQDVQEGAKKPVACWALPMASDKKEEQAARTSLLVSALMALSGLQKDSFRRYVPNIFPLLVDLVRSEHSSEEVPPVLSNIFQSCIGPIVVEGH